MQPEDDPPTCLVTGEFKEDCSMVLSCPQFGCFGSSLAVGAKQSSLSMEEALQRTRLCPLLWKLSSKKEKGGSLQISTDFSASEAFLFSQGYSVVAKPEC